MSEKKIAKNKTRVIMWLTYLLLIVALVSTVTLSRYMSTVAGTGTATVASFVVESDVSSFDLNLADISPSEAKTFDFKITNFKDDNVSNVVQEYFIEVKTTGNLPIIYNISTKEGSTGTGTQISQSNNTKLGNITFTGGELPYATETTHTYTLTAKWADGDENKSRKYMDEVDAVQVIIHSQQKD